MNDKVQDFNPNVVDEIRTVFDAGKEIDRIDIEDLFIAIDYWRRGQQKEHELVIQAFNAQKLSFFVYQLKSERTMNTSLSLKDQLNNYVFGLVGEVGEVVDLLKKFFYHGHEVDSERLKSELGDILWYVSAVASLFNINLQEIAQGNIEKLEKRYPEGFSTEASIKRGKEGYHAIHSYSQEKQKRQERNERLQRGGRQRARRSYDCQKAEGERRLLHLRHKEGRAMKCCNCGKEFQEYPHSDLNLCPDCFELMCNLTLEGAEDNE